MPTAKDGTNAAACFDGTCEVLLRPGGKFPIKKGAVGIRYVRLDSIYQGIAVLSYSGSDGSGYAFKTKQGESMQIERLALEVKYLAGDRAILRFYPKAAEQ